MFLSTIKHVKYNETIALQPLLGLMPAVELNYHGWKLELFTTALIQAVQKHCNLYGDFESFYSICFFASYRFTSNIHLMLFHRELKAPVFLWSFKESCCALLS